MSDLFTPRTPATPAPSPEPTATKRSSQPQSRWHVWWRRLVHFVTWLGRLLKKAIALLGRYARSLSRMQRLQHAGIILGIILLLFVLNQIFSRHTSTSHTTSSSSTQLTKENPSFTTILPKGTSASDYGGWTRVSPPDRNAVYAYAGKIGDVSIIVSEQPIPDSFKSDPTGSVQTLADSYSADRTFDAGGTTVYIGKSAKGPQSLILIKHDLLILIKSTSTVTDEDWVTYIKSLQ